MAGTEAVSLQVCEVVRENTQAQINVNVKRLDAHSLEIKELTRIGDRLTQLIEMQCKQLEDKTKQLEEHSHRLEELEIEKQKPAPKAAWYETSTGSFVVKTGMVILVMVVAAAIGQNYKDVLATVFSK